VRKKGFLSLLLICLLSSACTREGPPAPVVILGVRTRDVEPYFSPKPIHRFASAVVDVTAHPVIEAALSGRLPQKIPNNFIWPIHGRIISAYGSKTGGLYNDGINIAAPEGTSVAASADGIVAYVGSALGSYGNLVLIRHGGGVITAYAHLGAVRVHQGMRIRKGQEIGAVGATGDVTSAQLHFEIRRGGEAVDPARYLG
jgi:murein DD-endopeptidase MepM/ murein hydrolase activator NlpD